VSPALQQATDEAAHDLEQLIAKAAHDIATAAIADTVAAMQADLSSAAATIDDLQGQIEDLRRQLAEAGQDRDDARHGWEQSAEELRQLEAGQTPAPSVEVACSGCDSAPGESCAVDCHTGAGRAA
jgi:soluble cytochrome b562